MNKTAGVSRLFWLLASVYAVIVLVIVFLTAPGLRRDGLAALPAMALTLPTSLPVTMLVPLVTPKPGVGVFVSATVLSASVNIGIAYLIARWIAGRRGRT